MGCTPNIYSVASLFRTDRARSQLGIGIEAIVVGQVFAQEPPQEPQEPPAGTNSLTIFEIVLKTR